MDTINPGTLLISDPFLKDPNFSRTVVLLCEHQSEGSLGFVLNKTLPLKLGDMLKGAEGLEIPLYEGGPVQKDSLHFIHQNPDLIPGGVEIIDGIYWGGDFGALLSGLLDKSITSDEVRFFIGYSGWSADQLEGELEQKSWITRPANRSLVFNLEDHQVWKHALRELGGEYGQMVNYPTDPQLN